jgi:hypothetical protein
LSEREGGKEGGREGQRERDRGRGRNGKESKGDRRDDDMQVHRKDQPKEKGGIGRRNGGGG